MTEEKKKQLFIWSSVIGSILILSIFIWSMRINILEFGKIKSPESSTDTIFNLDNNSTENTATEVVPEESKSNDEIENIINSVNQDIGTPDNPNASE